MAIKVIKASAGTGKTYRLSMEYLSIMLKHQHDPEFSFKNILVITFTKKATAEIRDAVYLRLKEIVFTKKTESIEQLAKLSGKNINSQDLIYLEHCYNQMLINKEFIKISTIDSFINTVFKSMIAPIMNISSYQMQDTNNPETYEKVFDALLNYKDNIEVQGFLKRLNIRNKSDISFHLEYLIRYRWLNYFIKHEQKTPFSVLMNISDEALLENQNLSKSAIIAKYSEIFHSLSQSLDYKHTELKENVFSLITNWYKSSFNLYDGTSLATFESAFLEKLNNNSFLSNYENFKLMQKTPHFWNGNKLRKNSNVYLYECLDNINNLFKDFFVYHFLLPELKELFHFWDILLKEYDLVKFTEQVFTFDDLLWYTYEQLYQEENELISPQTSFVTNEFYEYLCMSVQYLLIDEFQDTSVMQFNVFKPIILELLSGSAKFNETGLIIVGDEKQSIYEWRGGERNLLFQMKDFLGLDKIDDLKICFRSKQGLIDIINYLFNPRNFSHLFEGDEFNSWVYDNDIEAHDKKTASCFYSSIYRYPKKSTPFNPNSDSNNEDNSEDLEDETDIIENYLPTKLNSYKYFVKEIVINRLNKDYYSNTAIIARTNEDLLNIEAELLKFNIPCTRESSLSLFEHDLIKAISALLKFLVNLDWKNLLIFLRSDIILMPAHDLKEFTKTVAAYYKKQLSFDELRAYMLNFEYLQKILDIFDQLNNEIHCFNNIESLINNILEVFSVIKIFKQDNDLKNLHYFLEIVKDFDLHPAPYSHSLDGFLLFCQNLIDSNSKKQTGLKLNNAVELLTIHKSKGLTFHSVFVYLSNTPKKNLNSDLMFYQFDNEHIAELKLWAITSSYANTLKELLPMIKDELTKKSYLEELNNLYVALTRAVQNMAVFIALPVKKGNELYDSDRPCAILANLLDENQIPLTDFIYPDIENKISTDYFNVSGTNYLKYFKQTEESEAPNFDINEVQKRAEQYLSNKSALYGSIVHDYLSYIKIANPQSKDYAFKRCLQNYGNLINRDDIENLCAKTNIFIANHAEFFSDKWDRIFNEYTVYYNDKVYRIDRMMLDFQGNKLLIIDYKTGGYSDEQLLNYSKIISQIPFVKEKNLSVESLYLEVNIK